MRSSHRLVLLHHHTSTPGTSSGKALDKPTSSTVGKPSHGEFVIAIGTAFRNNEMDFITGRGFWIDLCVVKVETDKARALQAGWKSLERGRVQLR